MRDVIGGMNLKGRVCWFDIFVAVDLTGWLLNLTFIIHYLLNTTINNEI